MKRFLLMAGLTVVLGLESKPFRDTDSENYQKRQQTGYSAHRLNDQIIKQNKISAYAALLNDAIGAKDMAIREKGLEYWRKQIETHNKTVALYRAKLKEALSSD